MSSITNIELLHAVSETVITVFISGLIGIIGGLILGIFLFLTQPKSNRALANKYLYSILGFGVNGVRSVPFIILLISIIPLTRLLTGTTIGTAAAIVPLAISAIFFYAKVCESALEEVSENLIETSKAFCAKTWQLVFYVLLPESLPTLIRGATLTLVSLVGYSAMAGTVGGGGLGELAINYGYERFNITVMIETVILLIILVQLIQYVGDYCANKRKCKPIVLSSLLLLGWCVFSPIYAHYTASKHSLKVGLMAGADQEVFKVAQKIGKQKYGLDLQVVSFNDYSQPNAALDAGSIDANIFQHVPFLNNQIKLHGYHLAPVARTFAYPFGLYSKKYKNIKQVPYGAVIALPNDPSNEGRALLLLAKDHLIKLDKKSGLFPTPVDITSNPHGFKFKELLVASIARSLNDVALGGLTNDYTKPAGFEVSDALLKESVDSPYANVIAIRDNEKNNPDIKILVKIIHSKEFVKATEKAYPGGSAIPAFSDNKIRIKS